MSLPRCITDFDQPQQSMSLANLRNTIRGLFQGDLMPLRPRASMILDAMEYATDALAQANWSGTGVTVTKTTTKQEGNYALQCAIDATGNRKVSKTQSLNLSAFARVKIWERVNVASSAIQFYLRDGSGNESYWDITTNGTQDTWQQDDLDLTTPDSNNGTNADLSGIVEWGFLGLDADKTYIFDTVKVICGLNVAVDAGLIASFYQQVYRGQTRITFAGGSSPAITAPTSNPRIDLLVLNPPNTLQWIQGTEASSPSEPTFPTDKIPICLVYCKVGMVKVVDYEDKDGNPTEGYILKDVRPLLSLAMGTFLQLLDTPSSYSGQALKSLRVNSAEDALEFFALIDTFLKLTDTPSNYTDAKEKFPLVNSAENALEFKGINDFTEKTTPHANDLVLVEDSEASNIKRKMLVSNLRKFGAWASKTNNTNYLAETDGFAVGYATYGGGGITAYVEAGDSAPDVIRQYDADSEFDGRGYGVCVPVAKGEYWKITATKNAGGGSIAVWWKPTGS